MTDATIIIEDIPVNSPDAKAKLITISGQLDESNVDNKAKDVYQVLDANPGKISLVFDFAGLDYMNSKSIGYLTDWYGKITERGGKIYITHAKSNIKDILQVVGLTQLIQLFESLDEAKTAILGSDAKVTAPQPQANTQLPQPPIQPDTFKLNA